MPHAMSGISTLWNRVMNIDPEEQAAELAYQKATERLIEASRVIKQQAQDLDAQLAELEKSAMAEGILSSATERRLRATDRRKLRRAKAR